MVTHLLVGQAGTCVHDQYSPSCAMAIIECIQIEMISLMRQLCLSHGMIRGAQ